MTDRKVLIIEDDLLVRQSIVAYLEDSGFQCREASNGREGVDALASFQPDLVLTDLRMPEMDGFGVLDALSKRLPEVPAVVITGTLDPAAEEDVLAHGARACLHKPLLDLETVVDTIRALTRGGGP